MVVVLVVVVQQVVVMAQQQQRVMVVVVARREVVRQQRQEEEEGVGSWGAATAALPAGAVLRLWLQRRQLRLQAGALCMMLMQTRLSLGATTQRDRRQRSVVLLRRQSSGSRRRSGSVSGALQPSMLLLLLAAVTMRTIQQQVPRDRQQKLRWRRSLLLMHLGTCLLLRQLLLLLELPVLPLLGLVVAPKWQPQEQRQRAALLVVQAAQRRM